MSKTNLGTLGISKVEFERQYVEGVKRGKERKQFYPRALSVKYKNGGIHIELTTGWSFNFDPRLLSELENASGDELKDVKILGAGFTIEWTKLDVHLGVGAIIIALLGEGFLKTERARAMGSVKNERKAAAVRENGLKGGRPKQKIA